MRDFFLNDREKNREFRFPSNYIKTTKYNAFSFLPRFANIYFLIISILSFFPTISPFDPLSAFAPFIFVVMVSVVREGAEDLARYKSDKEINSKMITRVLESGETEKIRSEEIQIGDILFIEDELLFPSDLILIQSSAEGVAFIQTSSLDGEKNLKKRNIPKDFNIQESGGEKKFSGRCECDDPNAELYEFKGNLKVGNNSYPLNANQLLLKGSLLKNTEWIKGIVVYTGNQTKLMMNSKKGRFKMSKVEKKMNKLVIGIFFLQICLAIIVGFFGMGNQDDTLDQNYLHYDEETKFAESKGWAFLLTLARYFLLLNTLIPISLIVSIEIVKLFQAFFIQQDALIYSKERDRPAKVSSASLNEELGQVDYIFSDKTGTLTRNIMEFKLCQVGYEIYGDKKLLIPEVKTEMLQRKITRTNTKQGTDYAFKNKQLEAIVFGENLRESEKELKYDVVSANRQNQLHFENQKLLVMEFLKLLSTAHQCMPETKFTDGVGSLFYQGPSPDEITLVEMAQQHGLEFFAGSDSAAKVRWQTPLRRGKEGEVTEWQEDRIVEYEVFRRMEFNSDRKRMSIVLRDPDDGHYKLYCKGADSIIKERLDKAQTSTKLMDKMDDFLTKASVKGFRTLLMAMKILSKEEIDDFMNTCARAELDINTREKELQKIFDRFERDLVLIGATCVEDRLQDNVPSTIADLQKAGIKIWMLTGDKLETAENIGYSCRLLTQKMEIIKCSNEEDVRKNFNAKTAKVNIEKMKNRVPRGILIEATALKYILDDEKLIIKRWFLKIAKSCEAVICCRVSPAQKANVVKLIKDDDPELITLAIGDGANDVSMILEAHIGVGLYGNEGMRAVQSGDYALGEFQYLWRLLLIHGRWNYIRIADLILYFFYKNIVFTLPQMFFSFINVYSGQTIYDDWYISFYNLFFTSLPLMAKAILDQDVNPQKDGLEFKRFMPMLYYVGQRSLIFNGKQFIYWLCTGIVHAIIVFLLPYFIYENALLTRDFYNNDLWSFSLSSFTAVILIVTLKLMLQERFFSWINFVCIFVLSILIYFIYVWGSNYTSFSQTQYSMEVIFSSMHYYLTVLLCVVICYAFDLFVVTWRFEMRTGPPELLRKIINREENVDEKEEKLEILFNMVNTKGVAKALRREDRIELQRIRQVMLQNGGIMPKEPDDAKSPKRGRDNSFLKVDPLGPDEMEFDDSGSFQILENQLKAGQREINPKEMQRTGTTMNIEEIELQQKKKVKRLNLEGLNNNSGKEEFVHPKRMQKESPQKTGPFSARDSKRDVGGQQKVNMVNIVDDAPAPEYTEGLQDHDSSEELSAIHSENGEDGREGAQGVGGYKPVDTKESVPIRSSVLKKNKFI